MDPATVPLFGSILRRNGLARRRKPLPEVAPASEIDLDSEQEDKDEDAFYTASQWQLMWYRFRRNRLAVISLVVLILLYGGMIFSDFVSPYDPLARHMYYEWAPPSRIRFIDAQGHFHLRPFVYGMEQGLDPTIYAWTYKEDPTRVYPIHFFVKGTPYRLWGLIPCDRHLFGLAGGPDDRGRILLLGADLMGRDILSRIMAGARISLTVGLVGVFLSFIMGIILGGLSGYLGGIVDLGIQRLIEMLQSFPSLPLWMALSAAIPARWPDLRVYFMVTVILSLLGWTGIARMVRNKFLALREEEYVLAAQIAGASNQRVILKHLLPGFLSPILAQLTLAIPGMVLGETSLSFLGLGLKPPTISWGLMLGEGQNLMALAMRPWLLSPTFFVVLTVLSYNFFGDGLRDAADPYA